MKKQSIGICIATSTLLGFCARAASGDVIAGVAMPPETVVAGKSLELNGIGVREMTVFGIFKVKAYVAGLYLERKNTNPAHIIHSDGTKRLVLHFIRDIKARTLREVFREKTRSQPVLRDRVATFNSFLQDVNANDRIVLTFHKGHVRVSVKGKRTGLIRGGDFAKALLSVWLGENPPNASLKLGLLGLQ